MATLAKLDVTVSANTAKYMKGMKAMNGMNARAGKSLTRFAKIAAGVGAVGLAAFAAMTVKSVKAFVEFEKGLKEVTTLSKFTSAEIKHMSKETLKMGRQFGQTFKVLHKARYDIVSAGFASITEQTTILTQANKLAVAGVTDVSTATDLLTSALNAYNLEASDAEDVADLLFTTVKLGKTTIDELAASMGKVMPIAKGAGVSLVEVGAALATMTAAGIQTAPATTALTTMLGALAAPASAAGKAMLELGIKTTDAQGKMLPLLDVVKQFEGMDLETIKKLVPSEEAAKAILAIANNTEKFSESLLGLEKRTGAVDSGFKIMAGSAGFQIDQLKMWWQGFLVKMGDSVEIGEVLGDLLKWLVRNEVELDVLARAFGEWAREAIVQIKSVMSWLEHLIDLMDEWEEAISDKAFVGSVQHIAEGLKEAGASFEQINDALVKAGASANEINEAMIAIGDTSRVSADAIETNLTNASATTEKEFISTFAQIEASATAAANTAEKENIGAVGAVGAAIAGGAIGIWAPMSKAAGAAATSASNSMQRAINRINEMTFHVRGTITATVHEQRQYGGIIGGYANGGNVRGPGGIDNVPIMGTAGEFMIRKSVAEKNYGALNAINSGQSGTFQFMADGGPVASTAAIAATTVDVSDVQQSWEELWENWPPEPPPLPPVPYGPLGAPPAPKDTGIGAEGDDMLGGIISNENLEKFMENGMVVETTWDQIMGSMKDATAAATESMVGGGFDVMADAMSNMVKGEKMFTAAHGAAMMKMAAQTILAIGKQAAVWAAFEIAQGIKDLATPGMQGNAVVHFVAAAKFGAVAIGAMAVGGALSGAAGKAEGGGSAAGGAGGSAAAGTPFGATGAPGGAAEGAEDTADGSGLVVNIHVEGHIVDEQKFLEEVVMPNMAKAVGRGAAYDGQYDMISERT